MVARCNGWRNVMLAKCKVAKCNGVELYGGELKGVEHCIPN
jgi:hypothetical protein